MKKTNSQNNWIRRQNKDYFFNLSKKEGYRSRAAYKLIEIHKKFNIIKPNSKVIDLGASPGGWTQVVSSILKNNAQKIVAIDKKEMEPVAKCIFFLDKIESFLLDNNSLRDNSYSLILSDMAPNSSGHKFTDQARAEKICYLALSFSSRYLENEGDFICKYMRGAGEKDFIAEAKKKFKKVNIFKPDASRKESIENYIICLGFNNLQQH